MYRRRAISRCWTAVANLIVAYMEVLKFHQNRPAFYTGSPYDAFLRLRTACPAQPTTGETCRLRASVNQQALSAAQPFDQLRIFITTGSFQYHSQPFMFGSNELAGLKIFLSSANPERRTARSMPVIARPAIRRRTSPTSCFTAPAFRRKNTTPPIPAGAFMNLASPVAGHSATPTTTSICPHDAESSHRPRRLSATLRCKDNRNLPILGCGMST